MVYPTGSLERFVKGLLEDTIPESSETSGRLTLIGTTGVSPNGSTTPGSSGTDDFQDEDMSVEVDFTNGHEIDDFESCSVASSNGDSDSTCPLNSTDDGLSQDDEEESSPKNTMDGLVQGSSIEEICSFQIMDLLDRMGAPRNGYDRLIALIRKQRKLGFRVTKAIGRETLMKSLKKKFPSPGVLSRTLENTKIFFFPFTQMLQDLLDTMREDIHIISAPSNSNQFSFLITN